MKSLRNFALIQGEQFGDKIFFWQQIFSRKRFAVSLPTCPNRILIAWEGEAPAEPNACGMPLRRSFAIPRTALNRPLQTVLAE
jgi:hypothetical protein